MPKVSFIVGSNGGCPGLSASSETAIRAIGATDRFKICVWKIKSSYVGNGVGWEIVSL